MCCTIYYCIYRLRCTRCIDRDVITKFVDIENRVNNNVRLNGSETFLRTLYLDKIEHCKIIKKKINQCHLKINSPNTLLGCKLS